MLSFAWVPLIVVASATAAAVGRAVTAYKAALAIRAGDHVVIEMFPEENERNGKAFIKKLVKRTYEGVDLGTLAWAACGAAFGTYHEKESVRQGDDPLSNIDPSWYFRKPGGGPLYDMTVYGLHALTGILGPMLLFGLGMGLLFVPLTIVAVSG